MPYHRSLPTAAVALLLPLFSLAQDPAPAPPPAADSALFARNVLTEAIIKLKLRERIAARIEQQVEMLNEKFTLEGSYYKDTGHRLRIQLDLKGLGDAGSTMLQVCDGKVLWDFQSVLNMKNYRRRDLVPILEKLKDPILDDMFRDSVITQLGFGGPESLLSGFQQKVAFDQFAVETFEGVESYKIGGKWKDRTGLFAPGERQPPPTSPLPSYIPSNIQLYIDKATLWPYRIEMIGNPRSMLAEVETRNLDPVTGRPIGKKKAEPKVEPSRITLKYTLLTEDRIKPDEQFVFNAPRDAASIEDATESFLAQLDQVIQYETSRKKAEAAKESDQPVLKAPIELPVNPATSGPGAPTSTPPK